MNPNYSICYTSKSNPALNNGVIQQIFDITLHNNNSSGVNGILLHNYGNFFQVLEGEKNQLIALFEKIRTDPRHSDIFEVYNKLTDQTVFSNYSSNFNIITTNEQLEDIRKYLNQNITFSTFDKLSRLLKPFMLFH